MKSSRIIKPDAGSETRRDKEPCQQAISYILKPISAINRFASITPLRSKEKRRLAMSYENGSKSYFSQTADKIEGIGETLRYEDLSAEMQARYENCRNDEFVRILSAEVDAMRGCMPSGQALEYHGIVLKDTVFSYESGDIEELYESINPEEYAKLDEMSKQFYQYYEWDDPAGWFVHFKEILEHVHWQIHDWQSVYGDGTINKCRVVALVFCFIEQVLCSLVCDSEAALSNIENNY